MSDRPGGLPERRRHPRIPFQKPIEIEWGSTTLQTTTGDLSVGGMFVHMPDPLWVGAGFSAKVLLDEPLQVDCVVRRVVPRTGIGVEFKRVDHDLHDRLKDLVTTLLGQ